MCSWKEQTLTELYNVPSESEKVKKKYQWDITRHIAIIYPFRHILCVTIVICMGFEKTYC